MFPLMSKEILLFLRSRKAFGLLLASLLLLGGVVGANWPEGQSLISLRVTLGRAFFLFTSGALLVMMGLLTPLMGATAFTAERESGTLDLLVCCGLSRVQMLLGKWLAGVIYQVLVLICAAPVLALVFLLGGVGFEEYLFAGALIALTVLAYGMIGLAMSCKFQRSRSALIATMVRLIALSTVLPLGLLLVLGVLGAIFFDAVGSSINPDKIFFVIRAVSPLWAFSLLFEGGGPGAAQSLLLSPSFIGHVIFQGLLFARYLRLGRRFLGRCIEEDALPVYSPVGPWGDPALPIPAVNLSAAPPCPGPGEAPPSDPDPDPDPWPTDEAPCLILRLPPDGIADHKDPVAVREYDTCFAAVPWLLVLSFLVSLPLVILAVECHAREFLRATGSILTTLLWLFIPIFAASAISREREQNTLDLLRTTPYSAFQIVRAKFRGIARVCLVLLGTQLLMPVYLRLAAVGIADDESVFNGMGASRWVSELLAPVLLLVPQVLAFGALGVAVAFFFSSSQRRSLNAILQTYLTFGALLLIPLPMMRFIESSITAPLSLPVLLLNPVYYFAVDKPGFLAFLDFGDEKIRLLASAPAMLLHAAVVTLLALFILKAAARRLEREAAS